MVRTKQKQQEKGKIGHQAASNLWFISFNFLFKDKNSSKDLAAKNIVAGKFKNFAL
ncbi:hypothetical protein J7L09_02255 [bacterium]|nr:hypothetical protein [bacterium]